MKKTKLWRGLFAVFGVLLAVAVFMTALCFKWSGQVNVFLNTLPPVQSVTDDTNYYPSDYEINDEGYKKMVVDSDKHDVATMTEGAVLVKNDGNALPFTADERRVTLFGRAVADPVYRGNSGGPALDSARLVTLKSALEAEGFAINQTLYDAYAASTVSRVKVAVENKDGVKSSIGEVPITFYDNTLAASYASDYNDAAIVMFSRDGGEGRDLFRSDADGISQLALHKQEADLLKMIADSGKFAKTIVLINSAYPMELGFLEEQSYGVDACLWIGGPGLKGFDGVADLLVGRADPSGAFVDTYAADSLSSAAVQNAFDISFANDAHNYIVEAEGIYAGYKYYETRYQDCVLGRDDAAGTAGTFASTGGWNYAEEVAYPFGYGRSYARFTETLTALEWDRTEHKVKATVKVKNEGYADGSAYNGESKTSVQLYVQLPYSAGNAEKSAIQLIDFAKTELLEAGEETEVTFETDDYIFATYDANAVNGADAAQKGCYVFDAGDYYFTVGDGAHDALNNVLAARGATRMTDHLGGAAAGNAANVTKVGLAQTDDTTYAKSRYTDEIVANRFDDVDINSYYDNDAVTYMSRDDWNTFPVTYDSLTATAAMKAQMSDISYTKPTDAPAYDSFTQGAEVTLKLVEMREVPFADARWETFLNQLTLTDMCNMIGENFGQPAVTAVGKNPNTNSDGPAGPQAGYRGQNVNGSASTRVNEVVAASTFSKELLAARGSFIAEDCLFGGTTQLWSPGANLHRTPFSGRNFEYYSEDSVMSYICAAVQCEAMQAKGCNAAPKHFAANDQETNRAGLCIYMNEQALRQGPFKGFEGAFTVGGALGTMMSCSRIGNREVYASEAVLTGLLRDEWGFKGITITDSVAGWSSDNPTLKSLAVGTDTFNARAACGSEVKTYLVKNKDGSLLRALRAANKHFFYAMSRSSLINGLTADSVVADFLPWWQPALIAICIVIGLAAAAFAVLFVLSGYVFGRKREV